MTFEEGKVFDDILRGFLSMGVCEEKGVFYLILILIVGDDNDNDVAMQ